MLDVSASLLQNQSALPLPLESNENSLAAQLEAEGYPVGDKFDLADTLQKINDLFSV